MAEKIVVNIMPKELTIGGEVMKAEMQNGLASHYIGSLMDTGVVSLDLLFFDDGSNVKPHHHADDQMELCVLVMRDGTAEVQMCHKGEEHRYPEGVEMAFCVKMTDMPISIRRGEHSVPLDEIVLHQME